MWNIAINQITGWYDVFCCTLYQYLFAWAELYARLYTTI